MKAAKQITVIMKGFEDLILRNMGGFEALRVVPADSSAVGIVIQKLQNAMHDIQRENKDFN